MSINQSGAMSMLLHFEKATAAETHREKQNVSSKRAVRLFEKKTQTTPLLPDHGRNHLPDLHPQQMLLFLVSSKSVLRVRQPASRYSRVRRLPSTKGARERPFIEESVLRETSSIVHYD